MGGNEKFNSDEKKQGGVCMEPERQQCEAPFVDSERGPAKKKFKVSPPKTPPDRNLDTTRSRKRGKKMAAGTKRVGKKAGPPPAKKSKLVAQFFKFSGGGKKNSGAITKRRVGVRAKNHTAPGNGL